MFRFVIGLAVVISILIVAGYQRRETQLSCYICRGLKDVETTLLFTWTLSERREWSYPEGAPTDPNHQHVWFPYTSTHEIGPWGCLGLRTDCRTKGTYIR